MFKEIKIAKKSQLQRSKMMIYIIIQFIYYYSRVYPVYYMK